VFLCPRGSRDDQRSSKPPYAGSNPAEDTKENMSRLKANASQAKEAVAQHLAAMTDGDGYQFQKEMTKFFDKINTAIQSAIAQLQTTCTVSVAISSKQSVVGYQQAITSELVAEGYQVQNMTVTYPTVSAIPASLADIANKRNSHKVAKAIINFTIDWS
jgi:hypothetical protein